MSEVPRKNVDKIAYFESHLALYTANAVAIGSTTAAVTALTTKVTAARALYNAQQEALLAAKNATGDAQIAIDAMAVAGAEIIKNARTKAVATFDDNIYTLAGLPIPSTPAAKSKPGTPSDFTATLNPDGSLDTKWKCKNPAGATGTTYQVYRSIGGTTDYTLIGGTGQRQLTDTSVPANVTHLTYKIQAVRSTSVGLWATFNVFFGSNAGGNTVATVQAVPVKIAA